MAGDCNPFFRKKGCFIFFFPSYIHFFVNVAGERTHDPTLHVLSTRKRKGREGGGWGGGEGKMSK